MKSRMSFKMDHVGSKMRSLGQMLEKSCVPFRGHILSQIIMKLGQNFCLDETSHEYEKGSCLIKNYCNSPKYSDTLNLWTPIIFCKNNLFFVPNFGLLVKFLSLNFPTRNYDGLEVQQRSAMIN